MSPPEQVVAEKTYQERCASCHNTPAGRMPSRGAIAALAPGFIYKVLTEGPMQQQAKGLSDQDRRHLGIYLGSRTGGAQAGPDPAANRCAPEIARRSDTGPDWPHWGRDLDNGRYQRNPGFGTAELPRLKLKWAFAYPGGVASTSPIVRGGRIYVGSVTGQVFVLDARTGCTVWTATVGAPLRAALEVAPAGSDGHPGPVYASDFSGGIHALDGTDGHSLWITRIIEDPALNAVSGSPALYDGQLVVPVTGQEDSPAASPTYPCCRSRGALVALDATTGAIQWRRHTIPDEPKPTKLNVAGIQMYGPAGAGLWTAVTIDPTRRAAYVGSGNDYAWPGSDYSDAILAYGLADGALRWKNQVLQHDVWVLGCNADPLVNCPPEHGPDLDFASPPIIRTLNSGRQILLAGSKSGIVYAFDPDDHGRTLWSTRISRGDALGAIMFGSAADHDTLYVSLSNPAGGPDGQKPGGLVAIDIATGRTRWTAPPVQPACHWGMQACTAAQPAPLALMDGAVFAGAADGHVRAYSTRDGAVLWDFDTGATVRAVNGVDTHGGGIGRSGAVLADGMLFVNAGDGYGQPGNALLGFSVDGR